MRELFVYYRIREGAATSARAAVVAMHEELRVLRPGLVARLLTRDEPSGTATWMETYAAAPAGVDAAIESTVAEHAARLVPFIDGARHVEAFDSDA
jgi:hypothetical protein